MATHEAKTTSETENTVIIVDDDDDIDIKISDIKDKMLIAHNIILACAEETASNTENMLNKAELYTCVPKETLNEIERLKKPYRFKSLSYIDNYEVFIAICITVRQVLTEHYIKKRIIPSLSDIESHLLKNNKIYFKDYRFVRKDIFYFHHLRELNKYLIIENPELVATRIRYINRIRQYRAEGRHIVYVNEKLLEKEMPKHNWRFLFTAASTRDGGMESVYAYYTDRLCTEKWVTKTLIPTMSVPCVFVISNEPNPSLKPVVITPTSSKAMLTDWLNKRNIPCDKNMHKADLYALFKKFSKVNFDCNNTSRLDDYIRYNGHEVLYVPHGYQNLNYFTNFWSEVEHKIKGFTKTSHCLNIVAVISKEYTLEDWKKFEKDIEKEELRMLNEDKEVENTIDNILTMVRDGEATTFDFPPECDIKHLDFLDNKVYNIIIDGFN